MKQGEFQKIVKMYHYKCPYCGGGARISESVWLRQDTKYCSNCGKLFRTNPDYEENNG